MFRQSINVPFLKRAANISSAKLTTVRSPLKGLGTVFLAAAALTLASPAAATTITIDFEDLGGAPPPAGCNTGAIGSSTTTQGFTFTHTTGSRLFLNCDQATIFSTNGTLAIFVDAAQGVGNQIIRMEEASNATFALQSVDIAEGFHAFLNNNASSVLVEGDLSGGGSVSQLITLDGITDGAGGAEDYETFSLSSSFQNLVSVTFIGQGGVVSDIFLLDNVVVGDPEPTVTQVDIDIKPGSFPNSINLGSGGATPVAILGSASLDVNDIDTTTLALGTAGIKTVGKKDRQLCSIEDVSGDFDSAFGLEGVPDGYDDLVCHFITMSITDEAGDTTATLSGNLTSDAGGDAIEGTDSVNIVP